MNPETEPSIAGLHVLMTADAVGGVWTYALDLGRGLAERGAVVTLAVLGPAPSSDQRQAADATPGFRLVETGLALDWLADGPDAIRAAGRAVASLACESGADLVHLNSPALAADAGFDVPVVGTCHSCTATWWKSVRGGELPADFAWRADVARQGYAAADRLSAPTRAFADATAEAYGLGTAPLVIPNGRAPVAAPRRADDPPVVFTAGRLWDEGKNVATLDRAAATLPVSVLAAGPTDGPNGTGIRLEHAQPLGWIDPAEMARHLAGQPVFASPALYEPFGLAVLEAAAHGCPLVLSDIPTFRELWDGAASFVPARDERALADAIRRLLDEPALRARMGETARERAQAYTVDRMVSGTAAVYCAALTERTSDGEALWGLAS